MVFSKVATRPYPIHPIFCCSGSCLMGKPVLPSGEVGSGAVGRALGSCQSIISVKCDWGLPQVATVHQTVCAVLVTRVRQTRINKGYALKNVRRPIEHDQANIRPQSTAPLLSSSFRRPYADQSAGKYNYMYLLRITTDCFVVSERGTVICRLCPCISRNSNRHLTTHKKTSVMEQTIGRPGKISQANWNDIGQIANHLSI